MICRVYVGLMNDIQMAKSKRMKDDLYRVE